MSEYERSRADSLAKAVAQLPRDPATLLCLLEQRYLLENLAWDNCPEFVALRTALRSETTDAKDAERYRWLKERYLGADFYYEYDEDKKAPVLLFKMLPQTMALRGCDLDETIDQAEGPK